VEPGELWEDKIDPYPQEYHRLPILSSWAFRRGGVEVDDLSCLVELGEL